MDANIEQLEVAARVAGEVIETLSDHDWELPTPCENWNVRDIIQHLIAGNEIFAAALLGGPGTLKQTTKDSGDLFTQYQRSVQELLQAFSQPGALERTVSVPFGAIPGALALHLRITELLVHGWDLARATGCEVVFPEDIAETELVFSRNLLKSVPPGHAPFGSPQPVADDAPAINRLVALLGRNVADSLGDSR